MYDATETRDYTNECLTMITFSARVWVAIAADEAEWWPVGFGGGERRIGTVIEACE